MNYPGYGQSDGPATLGAIPATALATYDELLRHARGRPIMISGSSLGTTAALWVASQRPIAGMILQNPPPLQRMILQEYGWWNLWLVAGPIAMQVPGELNSLSIAPRVKGPAVFVLAAQDRTVPPQYQQQVVAAYAGEKRVVNIAEADHNSPIIGADADARLRCDGLAMVEGDGQIVAGSVRSMRVIRTKMTFLWLNPQNSASRAFAPN